MSPLSSKNMKDDSSIVVVTGLGVVSSIGVNKDTFWNGLCRGESGINKISNFDVSDYKSKTAAEVKEDILADVLDESEVYMSRTSQLALAACCQALGDARLDINKDNASRVGVIIGTAFAGLDCSQRFCEELIKKQRKRVSPKAFLQSFPNAPASLISIKWGIKGFNSTIVNGGVSGSNAIGYAFDLLRHGKMDVIIAGGTDSFNEVLFKAYSHLGMLSPDGTGIEICKPFDRWRNGLILGEGVGILILEKLKHAIKRKTKIYARIAGYGITSNSYHIGDARAVVRSMNLALQDANLEPHDLDYVCASANGSQEMDRMEGRGIAETCGQSTSDLAVSSIKSMIGETNAAAGAIGSVASVLAMQNNTIPPTINYENPDPECNLNYIPAKADKAEINVAMVNSIHRGNVNSIIFEKLTMK